MAENNLTLDEIAKKHEPTITEAKDYFAERGVRLGKNYLNSGYNMPSELLLDILKYAKKQASIDGVKNEERVSNEWEEIYAPYFSEASKKIFGITKEEESNKIVDYLKMEWHNFWVLGYLKDNKKNK